MASKPEFFTGITLDVYRADKIRRSAVERQLEILGEACAQLAKLEPGLLKNGVQFEAGD